MFKNLFAISFISKIPLQQKMKVHGIIVKGLGEGAFFMSMPHYRNEISRKLGFDAYPGTLNIMADKEVSFANFSPIRIEGYSSNEKKFGGATCYKAMLRNTEGAIIIPDINKNPKNILEFIAPIHLKSKLNLKNGDNITISLK